MSLDKEGRLIRTRFTDKELEQNQMQQDLKESPAPKPTIEKLDRQEPEEESQENPKFINGQRVIYEDVNGTNSGRIVQGESGAE